MNKPGINLRIDPKHHKKARVYNCGAAGNLTAKQIALRAGIQPNTVHTRYADGRRGEDLLTPPCRGRKAGLTTFRGRTVHHDGAVTMCIAFELARDFRNRTPTIQDFRDRFDCSRATAFRWRRAWLDVFGPPKPEVSIAADA